MEKREKKQCVTFLADDDIIQYLQRKRTARRLSVGWIVRDMIRENMEREYKGV